MANRKQFIGDMNVSKKLEELLKTTKDLEVTEQQLKEQRISFAYGNSPMDSKNTTKDTVRKSSASIRLAS